MLNETTVESKLGWLKQGAVPAAWAAQQADPAIQALLFDGRLALLVDEEVLHRQTKQLTKTLRDAKAEVPERMH